MIGKTISHYKILEKLGEGGMGIVYKAFDTKLERDVALKVLRPEAIGDPVAKKRFIREAKAASVLNHPNITTIYEIDEWHGQDFICMEYVEGETVKKKIQAGQMSMNEVLNTVVQVADALQEAHEHDITHRDIKSENHGDAQRAGEGDGLWAGKAERGWWLDQKWHDNGDNILHVARAGSR